MCEGSIHHQNYVQNNNNASRRNGARRSGAASGETSILRMIFLRILHFNDEATYLRGKVYQYTHYRSETAIIVKEFYSSSKSDLTSAFIKLNARGLVEESWKINREESFFLPDKEADTDGFFLSGSGWEARADECAETSLVRKLEANNELYYQKILLLRFIQ